MPSRHDATINDSTARQRLRHGVEIRKVDDDLQGLVLRAQHTVYQVLQFLDGVHPRAVGRGSLDRQQHFGKVVSCHTADAEVGQLLRRGQPAGAGLGGGVHYRVDFVRQRLQLIGGVHSRVDFSVNHIAQQADFGVVADHAGDAQQGVVGGLDGIGIEGAVSRRQDFVVGIDQVAYRLGCGHLLVGDAGRGQGAVH